MYFDLEAPFDPPADPDCALDSEPRECGNKQAPQKILDITGSYFFRTRMVYFRGINGL